MHVQRASRVSVASALAAVIMSVVYVGGQGQAPAPPPAQPQGQAPAVGAPAGRGAGRQGAEGAGPGRGGGQRRGGFTQYTRPQAPPDVLVRGKALYETNCASCHMADLRGKVDGTPNLLRSGVALNDQKGELVTAAVAKHTPAIRLEAVDVVAVAEYIHSVHATMGGQGSPPGRNPTNVTLNVLVGDAKAGETQFSTLCAGCHTGTRSLNGIASRIPDPRALQNAWFTGSAAGAGGRGGGRGGGGGAGNAVTVTMADGSQLKGTLVRQNDFLVILNLPDGTRRSIARDINSGVPKVDVEDPQAAHKGMAMKLIFDDADNKKMHDITAFLATMK
jgi:cytochrome c oxidase cbb3-type subunit 3